MTKRWRYDTFYYETLRYEDEDYNEGEKGECFWGSIKNVYSVRLMIRLGDADIGIVFM